jgi:phosphoglucosamine mutase
MGEFLPTGDGLLAALHVLAAMKDGRKLLSKLVGFVKKYPQVLLNVHVKERIPLDKLDGVMPQIHAIEKTLGSNGRVLVRYSGTEPLLRIMLEGPSQKKLNQYANSIASLVKRAQ